MARLSMLVISRFICGLVIAFEARAYSIDRNSVISGGEFGFILLRKYSYILNICFLSSGDLSTGGEVLSDFRNIKQVGN